MSALKAQTLLNDSKCVEQPLEFATSYIDVVQTCQTRIRSHIKSFYAEVFHKEDCRLQPLLQMQQQHNAQIPFLRNNVNQTTEKLNAAKEMVASIKEDLNMTWATYNSREDILSELEREGKNNALCKNMCACLCLLVYVLHWHMFINHYCSKQIHFQI